jgi:acetyl-CoA carboxylase biotin carboxylase subunit
MRLRRALEEYVIGGVPTTLDMHRKLMDNADFQNGAYDVHWLEAFIADQEES